MAENTEKSKKNEQNQTNSDKKKQKNKARNWATVIYPDSMPENWEQIIRLSGLRCALSPIHDKDTDPDEEEKKPHYHLIFIWNNGSTTKKVAERFSKKLNGAMPIALESVRGYYRYFTHMDNPEKYQYDEKDIKVFNGFDIGDYVEKTKSEKLKIKKDLIVYIKNHKIYSYDVLLEHLIEKDLMDFLECATDNTFLFSTYLQAKRNTILSGHHIAMKTMEKMEDCEGCGERNANGVECPHD